MKIAVFSKIKKKLNNNSYIALHLKIYLEFGLTKVSKSLNTVSAFNQL